MLEQGGYLILKHFSYAHLPPYLQEISRPMCELAFEMGNKLPRDDETTVGLRMLLQAKDCFVRAALAAEEPGRCPKP